MEEIHHNSLELVLAYSIASVAGITFALICLVFNYVFRNRRYCIGGYFCHNNLMFSLCLQSDEVVQSKPELSDCLGDHSALHFRLPLPLCRSGHQPGSRVQCKVE